MINETSLFRSAGVLLHPSSLPSPYGIGDLGPTAYAWIDALAQAELTWWQILPLGPTGFGDSPYQCFSAFAGNPYLVSPQGLIEDGLLKADELPITVFPADHVEYGSVITFKNHLLRQAWEHFRKGRAASLREPFQKFVIEEAAWLDDFALFMAIKESEHGQSWQEWPEPARLRRADFLKKARKEHADAVERHQFAQFLFFRQWDRLRRYAAEHGLKIIGDIPIFVSGDSADVWANPQLFALDDKRRPKVVAGVPPDYFSATGQLWGNPIYEWKALEKSKFAWWVARFKAALRLVDMIRLDHFRGFQACWEIPAGSPNAIIGKWVEAPGEALLKTLRHELGSLPIIAEDLGVITPEVDALRRVFDLPGMRILQFAFDGGPDNRYLPHNYDTKTVVYSGTHDNDTTWGWYRAIGEKERDHVRRYLARDGSDIAWDLIRAAWASVADYAVAPLQDILNLGTEARMNFPGKPQGNWCWRFQASQFNPWILDRLADLTKLYGRGKIKQPAK